MEWVNRFEQHPEAEQGNKILAFGNGYCFEAEFDDGFWCSIGGDDFTHWMPRPDDPPSE